jgi:xanthine dehydrogenase small subunit
LVQFILNEKHIRAEVSPGLTLLDFVRYHKHLTGTKIGCREGDCGACSILVGEWDGHQVHYSNATSCLMPLANAMGKHIVTIEGINIDGLTAVQQAFADEGATQCGFCTPGFIVSLTGHCLDPDSKTYEDAIAAMNGNICRCTGYKSIQRAAARITGILAGRNKADTVDFAIQNGMIPPYFNEIPDRLRRLHQEVNQQSIAFGNTVRMGGGTDLYVQRHDTIAQEDVEFLFNRSELKKIHVEENRCFFGSSFTAADLADSKIFNDYFPRLHRYVNLISSTPIRNMGTIAGNFMNASPIGDFSIFFLALNARLVFSDGQKKRAVPLRKLYKGYKILDRLPSEMLEEISFELPAKNDLFNFEKVSKRTHLDIASVNSAIHLRLEEGRISDAGLSAGGVGPVPMFLEQTSAFLIGKKISATLVHEVIELAQHEISPISDARGTAEYKRLLLSQLIKAHFIELFPALPVQMLLKKP